MTLKQAKEAARVRGIETHTHQYIYQYYQDSKGPWHLATDSAHARERERQGDLVYTAYNPDDAVAPTVYHPVAGGVTVEVG